MMVRKEGFPFIAVALGFTVIFYYVFEPLSFLFTLAFLFCVWFFRDPQRNIPEEENAIVSPADGRIIEITQAEEPVFFKKKVKKISIFMSLFDVHVNRAPIDGVIELIHYNKGKFFNASLDKASQFNESNFFVIKHGQVYMGVKQISGVIARRIVFWKNKGDTVKRGERIGLIRFGSRVELFYDADIDLKIALGERVKAGETVMGFLQK